MPTKKSFGKSQKHSFISESPIFEFGQILEGSFATQ